MYPTTANRYERYDDEEEDYDEEGASQEEEEGEEEDDSLISKEDGKNHSLPLRSEQIGQVYLREPTNLLKQTNMIIANSADRNLLAEDLFHFRVSLNDSLINSCKFHKTHIKNITKLTIEYIIFPKYNMWNSRFHGTNEIFLNKPNVIYVMIDEVKSSTEYSNDELQNVYQTFIEDKCIQKEHSLFLPLYENDRFQSPINYLSNGFTLSIKGIDDYCYNTPSYSMTDRFHISKLLYYESIGILRLFPSQEIPSVFLGIGDIITFHNIEIDTQVLQVMDPLIQSMFRNLILSTFDTSKRKGFVVVMKSMMGGESCIDVSLQTKSYPSSTVSLSNIDTLTYYKFPLSSSPFPKNFILNKSSQYEIGFKIEHLVPTMKYDALG
jgi:hypothetical protein